jgi:hypothetical protein
VGTTRREKVIGVKKQTQSTGIEILARGIYV